MRSNLFQLFHGYLLCKEKNYYSIDVNPDFIKTEINDQTTKMNLSLAK